MNNFISSVNPPYNGKVYYGPSISEVLMSMPKEDYDPIWNKFDFEIQKIVTYVEAAVEKDLPYPIMESLCELEAALRNFDTYSGNFKDLDAKTTDLTNALLNAAQSTPELKDNPEIQRVATKEHFTNEDMILLADVLSKPGLKKFIEEKVAQLEHIKKWKLIYLNNKAEPINYLFSKYTTFENNIKKAEKELSNQSLFGRIYRFFFYGSIIGRINKNQKEIYGLYKEVINAKNFDQKDLDFLKNMEIKKLGKNPQLELLKMNDTLSELKRKVVAQNSINEFINNLEKPKK